MGQGQEHAGHDSRSGQGHLGEVPEEHKEAGGDKDPGEGDRVAVPDPLLLELGLVEANAKGRVPEIYCTFQSQCQEIMFFIGNYLR